MGHRWGQEVRAPAFHLDQERRNFDPSGPHGTFLYNNQVWLGVSYRTEDAIAPLIGYQIATGKDKTSMFKIGYSYDVTTSRLKNYSSGSHEIMLNYCMLLVKKPDLQIYKNVRFL
ncbi:MAG: type IX secretion system membrane protein PorP/SprF [Flavobacteriales bacterium]|nr:type IX secretion system membrane protein PorP/SprF [Flavobacteriales bacterium]